MGSLTFRLATAEDIPPAVALLHSCVRAMQHAGIDQWDDIYPTEATLRADVAARSMHVAGLDDGRIAGVVVLNDRQDPEYGEVPWTIPDPPIGVVHRLMVDPDLQGQGLARRLMIFVEDFARERGDRTLRLDAFTNNPRALRLYQGLGYHDAGPMTLRKGVFRGFEKALR